VISAGSLVSQFISPKFAVWINAPLSVHSSTLSPTGPKTLKVISEKEE